MIAGFSVEVSDPYEGTSITADDNCANEFALTGAMPSKGFSNAAQQDSRRRHESATTPKLTLKANNKGILNYQNGSGNQNVVEAVTTGSQSVVAGTQNTV